MMRATSAMTSNTLSSDVDPIKRPIYGYRKSMTVPGLAQLI